MQFQSASPDKLNMSPDEAEESSFLQRLMKKNFDMYCINFQER